MFEKVVEYENEADINGRIGLIYSFSSIAVKNAMMILD